MQESRVRPLSQEDPLEVEIATQIPFTDPSECGDTSLKTKSARAAQEVWPLTMRAGNAPFIDVISLALSNGAEASG